MAVVEGFLLQAPSTATLLGAVLLLIVVYLLSSGSRAQEEGKEPPGPKPLPLLGNLLLLNLKRLDETLCELSRKYGSVFTVHFGPKKVVVLAGFKTVKQALVNHAEEFGDRDVTPIFHDFNKGHGILFSNGDNWKEMRRFALTNLRDFGMGKRGSEEKIIQEIQYLREVFEKYEGKAFDATQPIYYASSNIISAIVYGSRFDYADPQFKGMVDRANETMKIIGSASIQPGNIHVYNLRHTVAVQAALELLEGYFLGFENETECHPPQEPYLYNMFRWLGPWLKNWRLLMKNLDRNVKEVKELVSGLQETLNPQDSRGFVDSFLIRKQKAEAPSTATLLGAVLLLIVVYLLSSGSRAQEEGKEPPGPKPLPLLGNLLLLNLKRLDETLCELSRKYGSVFTVHFGPKKVVVLAGFKTVKQALVNHAEEFGDRDVTPIFHDFNKGHGILFSNGDNWKEMRRFALTNLRDFGMGKRGSEEKIIQEIQYLREVFEKYEGKAFDATQPIYYASSNIISAIVYGSRFDYADPQFKGMVDRANETMKIIGSASIQPGNIHVYNLRHTVAVQAALELLEGYFLGFENETECHPSQEPYLYNMFPWLGPWLKNWRLLMKNLDRNVKEVKELVSGLQETLNPQDSRGFVDSFLIRKQKAEELGQKDSLFHEQNLIFSVANLFGAGTDTTGTTLRWGMLFMAKYPHIQDKVQEEISRVIGGRQPVVEDRKNLPYTDAVIHETQRLANIAPMSLPRRTSCDVHFQGFLIKKGTSVFPLLTSVLWDESEWESPHTFYPEHFLDEQGRFVKRDAFLPFSAGRRACLGESLARMELFLFFTSLLQSFRFTPPPGVSEDELDLTPVVGLTLNPSPHRLCAVSRS